MSQKINPINFRLGITQVWNSNFQMYGKSNTIYSNLFYSNFFVFQIIAFLYKWTNFLLTDSFSIIQKNKVAIDCSYLGKYLSNQQDIEKLSFVLSKWFNLSIILEIYPKYQWFSSLGLLINYAQHLLIHSVNKTKILFDLCIFFENRLGYKKVVNSNQGPILAEFVGFKVNLKGRTDNLGSQMAKSISYKVGILPLTSTKTFVEFSNSVIYTNLGTCGFQVWLFYKI